MQKRAYVESLGLTIGEDRNGNQTVIVLDSTPGRAVKVGEKQGVSKQKKINASDKSQLGRALRIFKLDYENY